MVAARRDEGLLAHRGASVAVYTDEDVQEIYSLRAALEALALERATTQATADDLRALERLVADMGRLARAGDFPALLTVDLVFHWRICELVAHRRLLETWESLAGQVQAIHGTPQPPPVDRIAATPAYREASVR